jgi:hypothetical protein
VDEERPPDVEDRLVSASHLPPAHPDTVSVLPDPRLDEVRRRLDDLLTRSFYSGAGYVFESDPYVVAEDAEVLEKLTVIREQDRRHAHVLGTLIAARGGVPGPGVFPFWNLDLNFLTVPTVSQFVVDALHEEIGLYDLLLARWPAADDDGRAALRVIRDEKARQVADLAPAVAAAKVREAETHVAKAAAVKKTRDARIAKQKAAAEAARRRRPGRQAGRLPAAAAAALGGRRRERRDRRPARAGHQQEGEGPSRPAPHPQEARPADVAARREGRPCRRGARCGRRARRCRAGGRPRGRGPRPGRAGHLPEGEGQAADAEDARRCRGRRPRTGRFIRCCARRRPRRSAAARSRPRGRAPRPERARHLAQEKAKRQMLKLRAASGAPAAGVPAPAAAAPAAPAPAAAAPAVEALPADLGDPNEAGISPKEKARRQMARLRAQRG